MPAPLTGDDWQNLLVSYLAALARACDAAGPCIIGHIKMLALFPHGGYLRISAVSPVHPPSCDGHAPDGLNEISLTLNVLVYGLPAGRLQHLTRDTALTLALPRAGQVTEAIDDGVGHGSGNHPHTHAG